MVIVMIFGIYLYELRQYWKLKQHEKQISEEAGNFYINYKRKKEISKGHFFIRNDSEYNCSI